jgi:hypothetical protein
MKNLRVTTSVLALAFVSLTAMSCKDAKKEESSAPMAKEIQQETVGNNEETVKNDNQDAQAEIILKDYFNLKDALVNDDNAKAKELAGTLTNSLIAFDASNYSESEQTKLKSGIDSAKEHAQLIEENEIKEQRAHFKKLSTTITEMVAITGTEMTLYEQFCPMYDRGTAWLSTKKEIRNPYYGSQMLTCGVVQREIN